MSPSNTLKDSLSKRTVTEIAAKIKSGSMSMEAMIDMIEKALAAKMISSKQALHLLGLAFKSLSKDGKARYPKLSALLSMLSRGHSSQTSTSSSTTVPVTGVKLDATSIGMHSEQSAWLKATVLPENATNTAVTWSSANPSIAKVDSNGKVSGVSAGVTTVTVKADGGYTASCTIVVTQFVHVTGISFGTSALSLNVGHHVIMDPIITPSNATNKTVKWESSYKGIATIDSDGMITGVAPGKVHITGTTVDGGKTADLILTVK